MQSITIDVNHLLEEIGSRFTLKRCTTCIDIFMHSRHTDYVGSECPTCKVKQITFNRGGVANAESIIAHHSI